MWEQVGSSTSWSGAGLVHQFWSRLRVELRFRTLFYYRLNSCNCWMEELLGSGNVSTLVLDDQEYPPYLRHRQDSDLLGVVCLSIAHYIDVVNALSVIMDQIRYAPLLLQLCEVEDPGLEQDAASRILKLSQDLLLLNVLLLSGDFLSSRIFYTHSFPSFQLRKFVYQANLILFPNKLANLQGHPIRTLPDNSEPHTIVSRSLNGELVISGPIWRLLVEFVHHINGTIKLATEPRIGESLKFVQVLDLVRNNTLDIAASLRPNTQIIRSNFHQFSYPVIMGDWCTMLPTERVLSSHESLGRLMSSPYIWLYLGLLYTVHRLLTQRRLLQSRLFRVLKPLAHLTLLCIVQAQLSAFFIGPQQVNHITSLRQLEDSGLRIMGLRQEFPEYPFEMRSRYASSFLLKDSFFEMAKHRNQYNSTYGYTVTSVKWLFYGEAQRHFRRPLFRYSQDICVQKVSLFSLVLQSNCPYRFQLTKFILRLHSAGLLNLWYRWSFYDMVRAGRVHFEDKSTPHRSLPIGWTEWQNVMVLYGAALSTSLAIFVIELVIHHVNIYMHNL
ncbi:hypothetical protein KR009_007562 [Drosophila setifemur]|nr:hypothetical protein KR009_007562 [Drosophila setifemur]